jgi:hypothetical protein
MDHKTEDIPIQPELIKLTEKANDSTKFAGYFLKFFLKFLVLLALILVILANTNPPKSSYVAWANDKIMEKSTSGLESGLISLFGNSVIGATTTSRNLYFGTVFTTTIGGKKVTTLGLFNQFIPISSK